MTTYVPRLSRSDSPRPSTKQSRVGQALDHTDENGLDQLKSKASNWDQGFTMLLIGDKKLSLHVAQRASRNIC